MNFEDGIAGWRRLVFEQMVSLSVPFPDQERLRMLLAENDQYQRAKRQWLRLGVMHRDVISDLVTSIKVGRRKLQQRDKHA